MRFLNAKETKKVHALFEAQYGITEKFDYVFVQTEKDDVFVVSRMVDLLDLESVRAKHIGTYIGQLKRDEFRPSIEGSQLLGPFALKNVLEVDAKVAKMWMYGLDIPCNEIVSTWAIVKSGEDFMGSGRCKEGLLLNHVPKGRRIHE